MIFTSCSTFVRTDFYRQESVEYPSLYPGIKNVSAVYDRGIHPHAGPAGFILLPMLCICLPIDFCASLVVDTVLLPYDIYTTNNDITNKKTGGAGLDDK